MPGNYLPQEKVQSAPPESRFRCRLKATVPLDFYGQREALEALEAYDIFQLAGDVRRVVGTAEISGQGSIRPRGEVRGRISSS
jgi:hypothetical protein